MHIPDDEQHLGRVETEQTEAEDQNMFGILGNYKLFVLLQSNRTFVEQ